MNHIEVFTTDFKTYSKPIIKDLRYMIERIEKLNQFKESFEKLKKKSILDMDITEFTNYSNSNDYIYKQEELIHQFKNDQAEYRGNFVPNAMKRINYLTYNTPSVAESISVVFGYIYSKKSYFFGSEYSKAEDPKLKELMEVYQERFTTVSEKYYKEIEPILEEWSDLMFKLDGRHTAFNNIKKEKENLVPYTASEVIHIAEHENDREKMNYDDARGKKDPLFNF